MNWAELHCEGFYDRAFLAGWLEIMGWTDPGRNAAVRSRIRNPITQKSVTKGTAFGADPD